MRRVNFSIGRFFPSIVITNTASFFQNYRSHTEVSSYRNELAKLAEFPHQEWKNEGLNPIRFVQTLNERTFYQGDQTALIKLLQSCCLFVMGSDMNDPALNEIAHDYARTVLIRIANHAIYNDTCINCKGNDDFTSERYHSLEKKLNHLAVKVDEILPLLPAEKKENLAFDMFKILRILFHYVKNMKPELCSAPDIGFSP